MSLRTLTALNDLIPWIGLAMLAVGLAARGGAHPEDSGFFIVAGVILLVLAATLKLTGGGP